MYCLMTQRLPSPFFVRGKTKVLSRIEVYKEDVMGIVTVGLLWEKVCGDGTRNALKGTGQFW